MNDKISVLMGVYNAESIIKDSVMTIENQTEKNIEFVICDDGSTDNTWELLKDFQKQFDNIVLLRNKKNMGLASSLNRCFMKSTGSLIARMDADDFCMPQRFEKQKAFLKAHPEYDLVGTRMIMLDDHGNKTYSKSKKVPGVDVFPLQVPFAHPTVLMHRYVLEQLGGYSVEKYTRRCEDLELWYRFFYLGFKGYNMPDYLYIKVQGLEDYRKRKVIHGCEMFWIHIRGLKMLHAPFYKYLLAVKPIVSAMIPKRLMMKYHSIIFRSPGAKTGKK